MCLLPACSRCRQRGSAGSGPPGVHSHHEPGGLHAHRLPDPHGWKRPIWHLQRGRRRGAAHCRRRFVGPPFIVSFWRFRYLWKSLNVLAPIHMSPTVYTSAELKLAVLQIRAPIIRVKFETYTVCIFSKHHFNCIYICSRTHRTNLRGSDSCSFPGSNPAASPGP